MLEPLVSIGTVVLLIALIAMLIWVFKAENPDGK